MSHKGRCFRGVRRTRARKKKQVERRLLAMAAAVRSGLRHQRRVQAIPFLARPPVRMTIPNLSELAAVSGAGVDFLGSHPTPKE